MSSLVNFKIPRILILDQSDDMMASGAALAQKLNQKDKVSVVDCSESKIKVALRGVNHAIVMIYIDSITEVKRVLGLLADIIIEKGPHARIEIICTSRSKTKKLVETCLDHGCLRVLARRDSQSLVRKMVESAETEVMRAFAQSKEVRLLEKRMLSFQELASIDELTQLHNSRDYKKQMSREVSRCLRTKAPLSLIIFDIDDFKGINTRFGHAFGSFILSQIGSRVKTAKRKSDVGCRYGGDEFAIIAPYTDAEGLKRLCEKIRRALCDKDMQSGYSKAKISGSFGGVTFTPGEDKKYTVEQICKKMFEVADQALYQSKDKGKNQSTISTVK